MPRFRKGVTYEGEAITSCVFCDIAAQDGPSTDGKVTELLNGCPKADVQPLLYKDEKCAVFWTRSPECAWHLLVVPLEHIQTVDDMIDQAKEAQKEQERIELLTHMKEVGTTLLDKAGRVLCQHFPNLERTIMADAAALPPSVPSPSWWQATSAVHADVRTPI